MKKLCLLPLALFLFSCGEREVKKMIIEPEPPAPITAQAPCHLRFQKEGGLMQTATQAALIAETCGLGADELKALAESNESFKN